MLFGNSDADTAQEASKAKGFCPIGVVPNQTRESFGGRENFVLDTAKAWKSPLEGSLIPSQGSDCYRKGRSNGTFEQRMEMFTLQGDEQKIGRILSEVWQSLAAVLRTRCLLDMELYLGQLDFPTATPSEEQQCQEKVPTQGYRTESRQRRQRKASPFANTSYLSNQSSGIPWPMMDFEQFQQNQSSGSTAPVTQPTHQAAQDLVSALKKAFPEPSAMPQQLREAYERAESNGVRQITKDLHAATSALGRARKAHQEASESRKLLKQGWMRHLQESLKAWESQLDNYRANMAKLQDAEAKALQEVSLAKKMISQLNTKTEAPPLEESTLLEDTSDPTQDKEEEKLRTQLQDTMTACLSTVGVKKEDVLEISDEEAKEGETKKRLRPTEHGSS